ncbi:lysine 2,3-aminomutase YodO family protein [Methanocaldococcus infernus ME]|uniref:Lysine 2,3-aminomutase YodO family protein n=1 Tax=Methanocaldococcus infernus (strain DSM 11812 / JCM 15783 / ME) TaxID=573063 RepID=D5VQH7_METIM|nr:lysine 2,3-aminomutase YodO family protein [Methanocaldococcus infernus ME]
MNSVIGLNSEIYKTFEKHAENLEELRLELFNTLKKIEWEVRGKRINEIDKFITLKAINIFLNIISKNNEELINYSTLDTMRRAFLGEIKVSEAFLEEIKHLILAVSGKSNFSSGFFGDRLEVIDFTKFKGREAGKKRSEFLDKVYEIMKEYLKKFPSGLDEKVVKKREKQKKILLDYFGATEEDWNNYKWQFKNVIKGKKGLEILRDLKDIVKISEEDLTLLEKAIENNIPYAITPYYLHLFDFDQPYKYDLPIRRQVIPPEHYINMMANAESREVFDYMGELDTTPEELITRRYVTIAIMKPYESCPQICVYCQRNWMIKDFGDKAFVGWDKVEKALKWFEEHESMIEILITGGDPLCLSDSSIKKIVERIKNFDHVIGVRFGTRTLLTAPMRITESLLDVLSILKDKKVIVSTHAESSYEITPEVKRAVELLGSKNIRVYNQHVYHRYVSRRFENVALRIALRKVGIIPYYTFYPKGKEEHRDYLIPIARIVQEVHEEARLLPGTFRTDEPIFNVPRLGKNHLRGENRELIAIKPDGRRVYIMHPWEKGIYKTNIYVYEDYPIKDYLDNLKELGEDIKDYWTIWYYY